MNKFIQSTKQFFNKKPVRIVTALLVIADYYGQVAQSKSDCSEAPCDLHNTTVDIQSYTCSDPSTTRQKQIQKVPIPRFISVRQQDSIEARNNETKTDV